MTRVLVKGPETALADVHAAWDEEENLIDTNLAFYDLKHLQHRCHEVAYPTFESLSKDPVKLPSKGDVIDYLYGGNDIVIRLPTKSEFYQKGKTAMVMRSGLNSIHLRGSQSLLDLPKRRVEISSQQNQSGNGTLTMTSTGRLSSSSVQQSRTLDLDITTLVRQNLGQFPNQEQCRHLQRTSPGPLLTDWR
ncbi:hypothetical protein ACFQIA_09155 [Halalkalicoccus sp. GCM10025704]